MYIFGKLTGNSMKFTVPLLTEKVGDELETQKEFLTLTNYVRLITPLKSSEKLMASFIQNNIVGSYYCLISIYLISFTDDVARSSSIIFLESLTIKHKSYPALFSFQTLRSARCYHLLRLCHRKCIKIYCKIINSTLSAFFV